MRITLAKKQLTVLDSRTVGIDASDAGLAAHVWPTEVMVDGRLYVYKRRIIAHNEISALEYSLNGTSFLLLFND